MKAGAGARAGTGAGARAGAWSRAVLVSAQCASACPPTTAAFTHVPPVPSRRAAVGQASRAEPGLGRQVTAGWPGRHHGLGWASTHRRGGGKNLWWEEPLASPIWLPPREAAPSRSEVPPVSAGILCRNKPDESDTCCCISHLRYYS